MWNVYKITKKMSGQGGEEIRQQEPDNLYKNPYL